MTVFSVSAVCVASSELSAFPNQNGLGPCMSQSGRDWGREGVELLGAAAEGKRAQQTQASTQQAKAPKIVDPMEKDGDFLLLCLGQVWPCFCVNMIEFYAAVALPLEELTPVLEQLDKARGIISASTVEMLQGDRHEYQNSMLESVETTLKQIQGAAGAGVNNADDAAADAAADDDDDDEEEENDDDSDESMRYSKENAASQLQMVEGQARDLTGMWQGEASGARKGPKGPWHHDTCSSKAAVAEAAQALQLAQESEQSLGAEKDAILKDQEESQKAFGALRWASLQARCVFLHCWQFLTTTWEAVKTGAFAGQEWRERNKAIEASVKARAAAQNELSQKQRAVVQILDGFGLDASLKAPLSAIEGVERLIVTRDKLGWHRKVAITTRLQKLREKVDNFEQEAIARSQAVTTAKEALASSEEKLRVAKDALQAAVHSKAEIEKEIKQSLLDGSSSMRFTLSLLAALTSGSDVTWSHELYDVEFIDLNQTPLTSVPKSQHEALIKILHVPDTHFSRESDASPWSDRMHRNVG
ncbi:hypothetical protein AK812_SmicGene39776 [Symbiodinium microadriaticum]|uniref:Uncharacterized protein n=1 Tax=Symbiodinium microadriaticum TaxID=2951 RepID=A0A1Q9CAC1_SYMMI|nr:hypothetical protein AK812_SmicGene39776 [Symbiodinium microadriaticum]